MADHAYYTHAMNWAYEHGVFQGDAEEGGAITGYVRPNDSISREEIAAVITRYAERNLNLDVSVDGMDWPENTINQDTVSEWARDTWMWIANTGIMGGIALPDGTNDLAPFETTTRAMFAKVVTSLIRDVAPGADERPDMEIGQIETWDVTSNSARILVRDKDGTDITSYCEFSWDGGVTWTDSNVRSNLEADVLYTVTARVRGDVDQANWMDASFRTAPQGVEQDAISTVLVDVVPGRTSVTLTAVNDNAATLTDGIEYALCAWDAEPTVWQDSPSFDGLELNFGYKAAARYKATATAPAGETVSVTFMIPEGQQQTAEAPAFLEVADVTDTTATVKAYDRYQADMTAQCEFSLDGNVWQDSPSFTGLTPDTSYNVYGRTKATGELAASAPVSLNFTTAPSADAGDEQGQVWVNEYRLVSVGESKAHGLGIKTSFGDDVVFYRDDDNPEAGTSDEMVAAYNALSAYLEDMLDVDAPYNDGWDRVTAVNNHSYWKLVKTGGHYETYDTAAEKAQLYAHGDSVITQNQRMVDGDDSHYKFTFQTSDGMTFDKKKEAWNHCQQASASIVSADVVSVSDAEGILYYQDVDDMIAAAGGTPGEAWCLAGTTILG